MTKHYPKKHLLGQKIESWKGLLIFAFLNSSSSHKRENEKLCVLKCSKKLPREQRLDQLLHLSTVCLATVNCSILSAKPTAISTHFSLFQKHLYSEIPACGIKCFSAFGHWSVRRRLCISHACRQRAQGSRRKAFRSKCWKGGVRSHLCPGHPWHPSKSRRAHLGVRDALAAWCSAMLPPSLPTPAHVGGDHGEGHSLGKHKTLDPKKDTGPFLNIYSRPRFCASSGESDV